MNDLPCYELSVTCWGRPWWRLWTRALKNLVLYSPPGTTKEEVERVRARFLDIPATVAATIREVPFPGEGCPFCGEPYREDADA